MVSTGQFSQCKGSNSQGVWWDIRPPVGVPFSSLNCCFNDRKARCSSCHPRHNFNNKLTKHITLLLIKHGNYSPGIAKFPGIFPDSLQHTFHVVLTHFMHVVLSVLPVLGKWQSQLKSASVKVRFSVSNPSDSDADLPCDHNLFC